MCIVILLFINVIIVKGRTKGRKRRRRRKTVLAPDPCFWTTWRE